MKLNLLALILCAPSTFAQNLTLNTLLSDLPDQTRIYIPANIEVQEQNNDETSSTYHCSFKNKKCDPSGSKWNWVIDYLRDTKIALQTNAPPSSASDPGWSSPAIATKNERSYILAGEYCLLKGSSVFSRDENRLIISDCSELAFVMYVQAGYKLLNQDAFVGFTLQNFYDEVGTAIQFRAVPPPAQK